MSVITEREFYDSRMSSLRDFCDRRISDNGNGVTTVAETHRLAKDNAQNSMPGADHNPHAKLTHVSSLSAPDVHQVIIATVACTVFMYILTYSRPLPAI